VLTSEEARALIAAAPPHAPTGARNRALLAMMYRSGLRPGEAVALAGDDLDPVAGLVVVRTGRRPWSRRTTGVDATTRHLVTAWLELRRARGIAEGAPLFCTLAGGTLTGAHLRQITSRLGHRAGVRPRAHPMALRYANAAELADEGLSEAVIERHLGLAPARAPSRGRRALEEEAVRAVAARVWEVPPGRPAGR
jgi:site-specific recombinase XerD